MRMCGSVVQCSENEVKSRMAVFKAGKTVIDPYGKELEPRTAEL